jgi:NADH-quinone oxidoreductase subunit H
MVYLIYLFIYGFILSAGIGLFASWVDRKVTARLQYRVGPPLLQPLTDIVKLLGKETLIPESASRAIFLGAPLIGLASVMVTATILWINTINPQQTFLGDLIVTLYLLTIPSLAIIVTGFASGNPLASLGSSREMKLILGYELPFILAIFVPIIKSGYSLKLGEILTIRHHGMFISGISGLLAFLAALLCVQAKLGLAPFDIAEAETEIIGGPLIECSGKTLAAFKLTKSILFFILPFFLVLMFMGGWQTQSAAGIALGFLKYLAVVVLITVIRNTNPRVRIDQALRFFWGPVTAIAIIAVALAMMGL